ncbi:MAG: Fe-S cluster assembly protein SufD [Pirellulaceae bacterium]|nr:Fe-S cluster assembly protein SufD [Pirellulaceae bacterium]
MAETLAQLGFNQTGFDEFLGRCGNEPQWLRDQRISAWEQFDHLEWPDRQSEEWTRTDIRLFKLDNFSLSAEDNFADSLCPTSLLTKNVGLAGSNVSRNGQTSETQLAPEWAQQGVLFGSLAELAREHSELIQPYLMKHAFQTDYDRFAALHAAWWTGGTLLYVPKGVVVNQPLHTLASLSNGATDLAHTLVILEDGAEATLLSELISDEPSAGGFHCGGVELIVGKRAHLRYVNLQNWGEKVWHFAHQKAIVESDASLQWTVAAIGSRLAKVNQHVALVGEGANSQVNGVMFTEGKQHHSYHTLQHHIAPHCHSDFLYKAALQDNSRTVWRGMIKVDATAQKTDGYQRNDNLLLSHKARADSIPGLEIEADDVRCTHGSTTGKIDEELIFYAMCRGFTRREATRAIVTGFFQQIFDRITIDSVRDAMGLAIAGKVQEYE